MEKKPVAERVRLLDPVDRVSETLFGLIMAVTIVGSLSIASAGHSEVRTVLIAALGCNLAWGMVDAVMYLIRTRVERMRNFALAAQVAGADVERARDVIAATLPEHVAAIAGPDEIEGMRRRLVERPPPRKPALTGRDFLAAVAIFLTVVIATFPVVIPFLLSDNLARAMNASRVITLAMLFVTGYTLGRYAGEPRPFFVGAFAAAFGAVLILAVIALGG
jgi:VIT1/CCC1 family predicted Fe2+/Mn2+ transporter